MTRKRCARLLGSIWTASLCLMKQRSNFTTYWKSTSWGHSFEPIGRRG